MVVGVGQDRLPQLPVFFVILFMSLIIFFRFFIQHVSSHILLY